MKNMDMKKKLIFCLAIFEFLVAFALAIVCISIKHAEINVALCVVSLILKTITGLVVIYELYLRLINNKYSIGIGVMDIIFAGIASGILYLVLERKIPSKERNKKKFNKQ